MGYFRWIRAVEARLDSRARVGRDRVSERTATRADASAHAALVIEMAHQEDRDLLFGRLLAKKDNKMCFDCTTPNPKWTSKNFGVFVCLDCSGIHRSLGVHISQVKSANMDRWSKEELDLFRVSGGNQKARTFFAQHGWGSSERGQISQKYTSRAAGLYKQFLAREIAAKNSALSPPTSPNAANTPGEPNFFDDHEKEFETIAVAPPVVKPSIAKPVAPTPVVAKASVPRAAPVKSSVLGGRARSMASKPKKLSLGAKKLTVAVDDRLFEQAPKSPEKSPKAPSPKSQKGAAGGFHVAPPTQGRFSYQVDGFGEKEEEDEEKWEEPMKELPRGGAGGAGGFRSMSQKADPRSQPKPEPARDDSAQARFGGAKSISSASFGGGGGGGGGSRGMGGNGGDRNMARFSNSSSISSADYYGDGRGRDNVDLTAAELMSKVGFQVKQDARRMKNAIGNFINDLK